MLINKVIQKEKITEYIRQLTYKIKTPEYLFYSKDNKDIQLDFFDMEEVFIAIDAINRFSKVKKYIVQPDYIKQIIHIKVY